MHVDVAYSSQVISCCFCICLLCSCDQELLNAGCCAAMQPAPSRLEGVKPKVVPRVSSWDKLVADTLLKVTAAHSKPLDAFCMPSSSEGASLVPAADSTKPLQTAKHTPAMQCALQAAASDLDAAAVSMPGNTTIVASGALASCTALPEPIPDEAGRLLPQGLQLTEGSAHSYQPPAQDVSSHSPATLANLRQKQQRSTPTDAGLGWVDETTSAVSECSKSPAPGSSAKHDAAIASADLDHSGNAVLDAACSDDGVGLSRLVGRQQHPLLKGCANPSALAAGVLEDANKPGQLPVAVARYSPRAPATAGSIDSREQKPPPGDQDTPDAASAGNDVLHETTGMDTSWATCPPTADTKSIDEQARPTDSLSLTGAQAVAASLLMDQP